MSAAKEHVAAMPAGLHKKLIWVREHIGAVAKSKKNQQIGHAYRTEEDIYNAIGPLLDEAGVMVYASAGATRIEAGFFIVEMDYTLVDADTGEVFAVRAMGAGDTAQVTKDGRELRDASGLKKAQTGAARYFFQKCFLISDGTDDEEDHGKPSPAAAPSLAPAPGRTKTETRKLREAELKDLAAAKKVPLKTALEKAGKSGLAELSDGELAAWISKMKRREAAPEAAPATITEDEAVTLRSAFEGRSEDAAAWLKDNGVASGMCRDCTPELFNRAIEWLCN